MLQPRLLPAQSLSTRERLSCAKFPLTAYFLQFAIFLMRSLSVPVSEMFCIKMYNWLSYKGGGPAKLDLFCRSDQTKLRCLSQFSLLHRNTSQAICFTNIVEEPLSKYRWWSNIGGGRRRAPQRRGTQDVDLWKRPAELGVHKQLL